MAPKYHFACPTHNRRASLLRSLESLKSLDPALYTVTISNSGTEELLPLLKNEADVFESHIREEWLEKLALKAAASGITQETIQFAISPTLPSEVKTITTGGNRNFLLLKLMGRRFFSFDDDAILEPQRIILPTDSHYMKASRSNPFNMKFVRNHEELQTIIHNSEEVNLSDFLNSFLKLLEKNNGICMSSIYGDSAFKSSRMFLGFDEESLTSLLSSPEQFNNAFSSRLICRFSSSEQSLNAAPFLPICSAFANDKELPPFFPIGRNEDGAYAYTLLAQDSFKLAISPFAIKHAPEENRNYSGVQASARSGINDIICLIWINFLQTQKSRGLIHGAAYFKQVTSLSQSEFEAFIEKLITNNFHGKLKRLNEKTKQLSERNLPAFEEWLRLVKNEKENYKNVLGDQYKTSPLEFTSLTHQESILLLKDLIRKYADLLKVWPTLRKVALEVG